MITAVESLDVPTDVAPETADLTCRVCDVPLEWGGRGRKPRACPEHRKSAATSGTAGKGNSRLATQAADVLTQWNSIIGLSLMMPVPWLGWGGLPATGKALADAQEAFHDAAVEALRTDAALCRMIVRAGRSGGRMSLVAAYGMMIASIAPVAFAERREARV